MMLFNFSRPSGSRSFLQYIVSFLAIVSLAEATLPALKSFKTSSGFRYGYIYKKATGGKPTYLLLHGFPSSVYDWRFQIAELSAAGYGVVAPDLLGYGGTDKPKAITDYKFSVISKSVSEILDHEGLTKVIGVGHDWGSGLLGRLVNFFPKYFSSLVFVSVPYLPGKFDVDAYNQLTEATFGYPTFGYMYFMNSTESAPLIEKNLESFLSLLYPNDVSIWKTDLCPVGKAKEWITAGKTTPLPSWETKLDRAYRIALFKSGGMTGPTNWYRSELRNIDSEAVDAIPPANIVLNQPVLFIGGSIDYITRPEIMQSIADQGKAEGWLPTVQVKIINNASHWVLLEKHREVTNLLIGVAKK